MLNWLLNHTSSVYIVNGIATGVAVIIVLLILSSNVTARKIKTAQIPVEDRQAMEKIVALQNSLAEHPKDVQLNIQMGNSLFDLSKFDQAIPYYKNALELTPDHIAAQIDLGVCYFNLQMLDSARMAMEHALHIDPKHVKGMFNLGIICYNSGDMENASIQLEELIRIHAGSPEAKIAKNILNKIKM